MNDAAEVINLAEGIYCMPVYSDAGLHRRSVPVMMNSLLAHKIAVGRILSVIGATATVVIFEYFFGQAWYIGGSSPAPWPP